MQKIILGLCLVLAVANGKANNEYRSDDFINMNRLQHKDLVKQYDSKLKQFNELYASRIDGVDVHYELVSESLVQTSERLNPIAILSDFTKQCVAKHSAAIPTVFDVKNAISKCVTTARSQQTVMVSGAVDVRNALEYYFESHFEKEIEKCAKATSASKHASCITTVTTNTNKYIRESQKKFLVQLEAALCVAKASVKKALDCSFTVEQDTITEVAKANILINRCIKETDKCKPCKYQCNDLLNLPASKLSGNIMNNPFYLREDDPKCLIVCAY